MALSATVVHMVTEADTAPALKSGDVPVLATPRIVALCEQATCEAFLSSLKDGQTTVGTEVQLKHLAAVRPGSEVRAEATVERVEGRRVTFTVSVNDDHGLVAAGKITRVIVDRDQFLTKAR
jgi:predicted thioesterase